MKSNNVFREKLDFEIKSNWRWERWNRQFSLGAVWFTWSINLFVFGSAVYVANSASPSKGCLIAIAVGTALGAFLPQMSHAFRFSQKQRVHDRIARELEVVKTKLDAELIDIPEAMSLFEKIHCASIEDEVNALP